MIKETTRRAYEKAKPVYDAIMSLYPFETEDLPGEIWRDIADCRGRYQISNFGRVKSFCQGVRILKPALGTDVYLHVGINVNGKHKNFLIHRLVAMAFIPNPEGKPEVNHVDTDKFNNYVGNLAWVTSSENAKHAIKAGRVEILRGCDNGATNLTAEQIAEIRRMCVKGSREFGLNALARKLGIALATVGRIVNGETFKTEGGKTCDKIDNKVPVEIREQIRKLYKRYSREFGINALSKRFGICPSTVRRIIYEVRK